MRGRAWKLGALSLAVLLALLGLRGRVLVRGDSASCGACHVEEHRDWSESRHAVAFLNPTFQVSYRQAEHPWCLRCHAASSPQEGVSCSACHRGESGLVGHRPSLLARLVHPIAHEPLKEAELCGRCHQFTFPLADAFAASKGSGEPLAFSAMAAQDTVAEWRSSAAAAQGRSCSDCHEPHAAPGAHDRSWMRRTVSVAAEVRQDRVDFTLTARETGHSLPTGDPFRRMRLTLCPPQRCDRPIASRTLERRLVQQGSDWRLVSDSRIGPDEPARLSIPLSAPLPVGARWRLSYHLADPLHVPLLPPEEGSFLLAEGTLVADDDWGFR